MEPTHLVFKIFGPQILQHFQTQLPAANSSLFKFMHTEGKLSIQNSLIPVDRILFDTGALHANYYINASIIKSNYKLLSPHLIYTDTTVTLADKKTQIDITHVIKLKLTILNTTRVCYFFVLDHMTTDVIIGLPSILYHFYDVFSTLLSTARRLIVNDELRDFPRYVNSDHKPDVLCSMEPVCDSAHDCRLIPPWTSLDQPAPEDVESYEPVMFKCALHFMEMTVQQGARIF